MSQKDFSSSPNHLKFTYCVSGKFTLSPYFDPVKTWIAPYKGKILEKYAKKFNNLPKDR